MPVTSTLSTKCPRSFPPVPNVSLLSESPLWPIHSEWPQLELSQSLFTRSSAAFRRRHEVFGCIISSSRPAYLVSKCSASPIHQSVDKNGRIHATLSTYRCEAHHKLIPKSNDNCSTLFDNLDSPRRALRFLLKLFYCTTGSQIKVTTR